MVTYLCSKVEQFVNVKQRGVELCFMKVSDFEMSMESDKLRIAGHVKTFESIKI